MKINSLIGKKFGSWTVLEEAPKNTRYKNATCAFWKCKCDCGYVNIVAGNHLKSGDSKSCGCSRFGLSPDDVKKGKTPTKSCYIGRKYGKLTIESIYKRGKNNTLIFNCICDCGKKQKQNLDRFIQEKVVDV